MDETFERIDPSNPGREELARCAGTYRSPELATTLTVLMSQEGGLVVTQHRGPTRPLSPAYKDSFTDDNKATYIFSRGPAGKIDGLTLALERVHHMRFDRV
jgi:hypothetical protein